MSDYIKENKKSEEEKIDFQSSAELSVINTSELIDKYNRMKEEKYLTAVLNTLDPVIDKIAHKVTTKYSMDTWFEDIKQSCVIGIIKAINNYDSSKSSNFLKFAQKYYINTQIANCIRELRPGFSVETNSNDKSFRKIMWLNNQLSDKVEDIRIDLISKETKLSPTTVKDYLLSAQRNSTLISLDDQNESYFEEIRIENWYQNPLYVFLRKETLEELHNAFNKLNYQEKDLICSVLKLEDGKIEFNDEDLKVTFKQLGLDYEISADSASRAYKRALRKMKNFLYAKFE